MSADRRKKRVLIVDDSAVVRQALTDILNAHPDLEVMGAANDPIIASERMKREVPDVITLDVEMPRMDGVTFLRRLMAQRPIPVVICSSLVGDGTATLTAALDAGAVDVIAKPQLGTKQFFHDNSVRIQDAVLGAAQARLDRRAARPPQAKVNADAILPPPRNAGAMLETTQKVVAIGASTGGTEALRVLLEALPPFCPPVVIVQHMPAAFTAAFAQRLNRGCAIEVKEAAHGDSVIRGRALIAPGDRHALLARSGANYRLDLRDGPLVSRHRPSVDVLFRSVARHAGRNAIGVIMTGMGDDGAQGLKEMRDAGARTFGQSEATCVVYGMPTEAMRAGAVERELDLADLAGAITRYGVEGKAA
jgi:two-component system chemotaxis response regulator CheB